MGLFGRKKVADALGVNASRISQMATSGDIIPAIDDDDGLGRGWPKTYVEEVAGRRQRRQTSRSIYSIPAPALQYASSSDTIVEEGERPAFVHLLDVNGDRIGLITTLQDVIRHPRPFHDQPDSRNRELATWGGDDFIPTIHAAATDLNVSPFDVAWVHLGDIYATELVLTSEPASHLVPHRRERFTVKAGVEETTRIERIPWATLHAKLGAPVPVLGAPTLDAVEEWRQANRTPIDFTVDVYGHYNTSLAASLLADLVDKYAGNLHSQVTNPELEDALRLAVSRLVAELDWSRSGELGSAYFIDANEDDVDALTTYRQTEFVHQRDRVSPKLIDNLTRSTSERQAAANLLGRLRYEEYGDYGSTPSPALSLALKEGINAIVSLTHDEWMEDPSGNRASLPQFHSVRPVSLAPARPTSAHTYVKALAEPRTTSIPAYRVLKELETKHSSFESVLDHDILVDPDGNYVLVQTIDGYSGYGDENEPHDRLSIVVPTATLVSNKLDHLKDFHEILVDPDTQRGPVWLRLPDDSIHVMPFGAATKQGFTHGYGGTGPRNLADAIRGFLEWSTEDTITSSGRERLSAIIVGSDQMRELRIDRSQVIQPGAFTPVPEL